MKFIRKLWYVYKFLRKESVKLLISDFNRVSKEDRNRIFIACFPKSGSTYVSKTLSQLLNYKYVVFNEDRGGNEQDLDTISLFDHKNLETVTHQHVRGNNENIIKLIDYKIKPVILTRNIFDSVVSFRDHLLKENINWPQISISTKQFKALSKEEQYNYIIEYAIPWYLNFYVSWYKSPIDEILWVKYEDLLNDPLELFHNILSFYSLVYSKDKLLTLINNNKDQNNRFNIGKKGRGFQELKEYQIENIQKKGRFYSEIDFSIIGI